MFGFRHRGELRLRVRLRVMVGLGGGESVILFPGEVLLHWQQGRAGLCRL